MSAAQAKRVTDQVPEFRAPPPRARAAHIIRDDAEAIELARELAAKIAAGAVKRDRERTLPYEEMEWLSDAGLLAITVPREYGGAGVRAGTVAEVIATLASADGSIGQIPQNHFFMLEALRLEGTPEQKLFFYDRILKGERVGNALSEIGTKTAQSHGTKFTLDGDIHRVNGRKYYSTGVLFAHWVAVVANDEDDISRVAFLPRDSTGITIVDDWTGFGQRVTGSGTTILDNVAAHPISIIPFAALFQNPTPMGPFAQIMHAAIEAGIARGALKDAIHFVRTRSRPFRDSGYDHAYQEPYIIAQVGELQIRVSASNALLERAGHFVDAATANPTVESVAAASVAVAESKAASTETALFVTNKLIELTGTSSTLQEFGLDRHWRNARTHSVHDPVRWKYRAIGDYWLNGINPPRHGAI